MAMTSLPALPQNPKSAKVQVLPADASGLKTVYTGGANGSKITAVIATQNDVANTIVIGITNTAIFYPLATYTLPANAGQVAGTPSLNLLDPTVIKGLPIDNDGNPYIFLSSASDLLQVKVGTTVTAAKEVDVNAFGADF